jgi:hypothetical protein
MRQGRPRRHSWRLKLLVLLQIPVVLGHDHKFASPQSSPFAPTLNELLRNSSAYFEPHKVSR